MRATCVYAWTEEVADGEYEHYAALCDDDGEPLGDPTVCDRGTRQPLATGLGWRSSRMT
jgi:hypothetical protein